jgi:hypothetical protein
MIVVVETHTRARALKPTTPPSHTNRQAGRQEKGPKMDPYSSYPPGAAGATTITDPHHPDNPFLLPPTIASRGGAAPGAAAAAGGFSSPTSDKARLGELAFLKTTLLSDGFFLPADWEESVLGLILSGLRCVCVWLSVGGAGERKGTPAH